MPAPALGVFAWIASITAGFITWLAAMLGKKAAVAITVGATFVASWIAFQALAYLLWTNLAWQMPPMMQKPVNMIAYSLPTNFSACMTAMVSAKIARWLFDVQMEWIKITAQS
jgi:hypothetical protein